MTTRRATQDQESAAEPRPKLGSRWTSTSGYQEFKIQAIWNPHEEDDLWVEYSSDQGVYSCRLAAFLTRFYPRAD